MIEDAIMRWFVIFVLRISTSYCCLRDDVARSFCVIFLSLIKDSGLLFCETINAAIQFQSKSFEPKLEPKR